MDRLDNAGRLTAIDYLRATLYSTLSLCDMCSGAALLYKIPKILVGENRTLHGPEDFVRSRGVNIPVVDSTGRPLKPRAVLGPWKPLEQEQANRLGYLPSASICQGAPTQQWIL